MMSSRSLRRILAIALACTFSSLPLAAQAVRSYQVDLVVFTLQSAEGPDSEQWLDAPPPLDSTIMSRAISPVDLMAEYGGEAMSEQKQPVATTGEKEKDIDFDDVLARIRKDPRRKIVLTASWIQPVQEPGTTPVIHITDRVEEPEAEVNSIDAPALHTRPTDITGMPIAQDEFLPLQPPLIDGFVNFYISGYYTLEVDLRYTPEIGFLEMEDPQNPEYTTYRIHEKRRMKSDELNYYDHPKFGVLLLVNPAEVTETVEETPQS